MSTVATSKIEYLKPTLSREDLKGVLECLVDEQLSTGEMVRRFEKVFSATFGFKYSISLNSLTSAYHCALRALGVSEGDHVILSDIAPISALDAIYLLKAKPIPIDIGKHSFLMDSERYHEALEQYNPKVVILNHSFGSIANAKNYPLKENTFLLEDFTEAIGTSSGDIPVGKQGHIGICGLNLDAIITTGNGAMLVTSDKSLLESVQSMITGRGKTTELPRFDYNLIDYQAALGLEQLSKLGVLIERKNKIGIAYLQAVQGSTVETYFHNPQQDTFNRFPIVIPSWDYETAHRYFSSLQIETSKAVLEPIHSIIEEKNLNFLNSERLHQKGICIPIYPNLTKENIQRIVWAIRKIY